MNYSINMKEFSERFYTQPLLAFIELIAIVIGIKHCWKDKTGKLFVLFFAFDLIIHILDTSLIGSKKFSKAAIHQFVNTTNTLVTIFEINIYYFFFSLILNPEKKKSYLFIIPLLYTFIAMLHISFISQYLSIRKNQVAYILYTFELALILIPVILFFYYLIKTNCEIPLFSRPSFWISVGIFFQCIISIPCYLLISYLLKQKTAYMPIIEATLYYTPFIINTLCIIKAFLCKRTLTT